MKLKTGCLTVPATAMVLLCLLVPASAHWTNLDKYGCHNNKQTKQYVCHLGIHAGKSYPSQAAMLADIIAPTPTPTPTPDSPAFLAALSTWDANMKTAGQAVCTGSQANTYYDSARVYYQIADYTKDSAWNACAKAGILAYRDGYLKPNGYKAAGWDIFPHGLLQDWVRTADTASKDALLALAQSASYAGSYPLEWTVSADSSREVAYNVESKLIAVSLGGSVWGLAEQVEQAFGHVDQWTKILNGQASGTTATYVRPFMASLTAEALIQWAGTDPAKMTRVVAALRPLFDLLWASCWLPDRQSMTYTDKIAADGTGGRDASPDLNLLIAPVYAWLFQQTKEPTYRDHVDALFIGGVTGAYLGEGKMFNQNYRWSIQGLQWRKG